MTANTAKKEPAQGNDRTVFVPKGHSGNLMSIGEALEAAYREANVSAPSPITEKRRWRSVPDREITWDHAFFGSVTIQVSKFQMGKVEEEGVFSWAPVFVKDARPDFLVLHFNAKLKPGVRLVHVKGDEPTEVTRTKIPSLYVNVKWHQDAAGDWIPTSRQTDRDNIDLIFLQTDGTFIQIQISVTSRDGRFWLGVQEFYCGQVVRTTQLRASAIDRRSIVIGGHAALVAPLYPENAYPGPGSDYVGRLGKESGKKLVWEAVNANACMPLSRAKPAKWEPRYKALTPEMVTQGYHRACVLFFNLVLGWGIAVCEDGGTCLVHFKFIINAGGEQVLSRGEFPRLQPMAYVALKWMTDEDGKRSATVIRAL